MYKTKTLPIKMFFPFLLLFFLFCPLTIFASWPFPSLDISVIALNSTFWSDHFHPTLLAILFFMATMAIFWFLDSKKKQHKKNSADPMDFLGQETVIISILKESPLSPPLYQIKMRGEIWHATSPDLLKIGDLVKINKIDSLNLKLEIAKISMR